MRITNGYLVADETEQTVIAEVRALIATGMSQRAVAATLTERGHRGRTGKPYTQCQVRVMAARRKSADQTLVPDEYETRVIRECHRLRAAGLSLRGIVNTLAERGYMSRAGNPLGLTQVVRILASASVD